MGIMRGGHMQNIKYKTWSAQSESESSAALHSAGSVGGSWPCLSNPLPVAFDFLKKSNIKLNHSASFLLFSCCKCQYQYLRTTEYMISLLWAHSRSFLYCNDLQPSNFF